MNRLPWTEEEVNFALGIHQTNSEQELRQQLRPFVKTKKKNTKQYNLRLFNQELRQQLRPFVKTKKKNTKQYNLRLFNQKRQTFNDNVKNL